MGPMASKVLRTRRLARPWIWPLLVIALAATGLALAPSPGRPGVEPLPHAEALAASAGDAPKASSLTVGDQVEVVATYIEVQQAPSSSSPIFATEPTWRQGITVAGGVLSQGKTWWMVSWDDNHTGWSVASQNSTVDIRNITGSTVAFNRTAAMAYALQYWDVVTSDGYFWNGPDSYVSYAQGTSVVGLSGDDCAHFVSQVIGDQSNQPGGGLNIPSRVPPTYGEPSAPDLGNDLLTWGWGVQVNETDQLEPGDVINYEWNPPDGTWDHIAVYLGNNEVAAHTDSNWDANWTLGGFYAVRMIHILGTTQGGSGIDHPLATLSLSTSSGSAPLTVTATVSATGGSDTYASEEVFWGDGSSTPVSGGTATHTYSTPGTFAVDAKVVDSLREVGWSPNATVAVSSGVPPLSVELSATPLSGTNPLNVTFTATASGGSGSYASYAWTFGDGTSSTTPAASTTHVYTSAGKFSASVQVTDGTTGAKATSTSVSITVSSPPPLTVDLAATPTSGTAPMAVAFTAQPSGGSGSVASFAWTFGDGTSATTSTASVSHTYTAGGSYLATVEVTDTAGARATSSSIVIAVASAPGGGPPGPLAPTLSVSTEGGTAPLAETLTLEITGGVAPYRVAWSFGDGTSTGLLAITGSSAETNHTYTSGGNFTATVTVEDATGATAEASQSVQVAGPGTGGSASGGTSSGAAPWWAPLTSEGVLLPLALGLVAVVAIAGVAVHRRRRSPPVEPGPEGSVEAPLSWAPPPG